MEQKTADELRFADRDANMLADNKVKKQIK